MRLESVLMLWAMRGMDDQKMHAFGARVKRNFKAQMTDPAAMRQKRAEPV